MLRQILFGLTLATATPTVVATAAPDTTKTSAPSATDVVDKVQGFYASIKQVTAQFRQTVTNDMMGSTKTSDGTLWLLKPGKMRWDYLEKKKDQDKKEQVVVKKSFITNGTTLWVVEHDNKQVIKKSVGSDMLPVAVSFLYGKGDLKTEFNAELDTSGKYNGKDDIVLKLTPKKPSAQYKTLFLVVNSSDYHVSQSIIIDASNNVNHFRFFSPDFEKSIKDTWFDFDERSVKNYRVIDADQKQDGAGSGSAGSAAPAETKAPAPAKTP
jgi:outer membrane lipoprotein-sorting protein